MRKITPADEYDNPEKVRKLVIGIVSSNPESAEKLVILLKLVTNPDRSQAANWCSLSDAIACAFSLTEAFDKALDEFVREPLRAVA